MPTEAAIKTTRGDLQTQPKLCVYSRRKNSTKGIAPEDTKHGQETKPNSGTHTEHNLDLSDLDVPVGNG